MGDMNMKKKIVMQLLTMCMVASLAIGTPVVSYAENTGKEITKSSNEEKQDDIIEITKDSIGTVIYDENDIKVTIQDLVHKDNSGNPQPGIVLYATDVILCGARIENTVAS